MRSGLAGTNYEVALNDATDTWELAMFQIPLMLPVASIKSAAVARATNDSSRVYSTMSCPGSSRAKRFRISHTKFAPFLHG